MNIVKIFSCAIATCLVAVNPAFSQESFSARSFGTAECSEIVEKASNNADVFTALSIYASGFITGKNVSVKEHDVFPILNPIGQLGLFVVLVCSSNADKNVAQILAAVVDRTEIYHTSNKRDKSLTITSGETTIIVYEEYLLKAQSFLRSKGYKVRADGLFGDRTQKAFKAYKAKNNVQGDAVPDAHFYLSMISHIK
jgi:hypothetical protein